MNRFPFTTWFVCVCVCVPWCLHQVRCFSQKPSTGRFIHPDQSSKYSYTENDQGLRDKNHPHKIKEAFQTRNSFVAALHRIKSSSHFVPLTLHYSTLLLPLGNLGIPVLADSEFLQVGRLVNDKTLLVGQMQQADEAKRRRDVVHDGLGIHCL